jgi:phospholipid/cholesterol/gamma-HCH transport system substrate-binding protein
MLTRFIKIQLAIFTAASIVGITVMVLGYIQAPTLLGIGRITVTLELPTSGGLYQFSNVTYRGVQVGKITSIDVTRHKVSARMSLATSPKIPADLRAEVHSVSAIGEQYVDLQPRTRTAPYLHDGSVIVAAETTTPPPVGPMLDRLSGLVGSIPTGKLSELLDETFTAFNGSGYDVGSLLDSSARVTHDFHTTAPQASTLINDSAPFLDAQARTGDQLRTWARSLAGFTGQLVADDAHTRTLLQQGPAAIDETTRLLNQLKPTLPVLLANLTTINQIGITYHAGIEQLLVLLPPLTGYFQTSNGTNNASGIPYGDFTIATADPPGCTVGFLPPSSWRSPDDQTVIDTPNGLYCKLPQDSPIAVRGARNYPCQGHPGKRAPTVAECDSDKPYAPLAMRQHILGPSPLDPNLLSQGVPPDDRTTFSKHEFAPLGGTPLPPGAQPRGTPPAGPAAPAPPPPSVAPPPAPSPAPGGVPAAPSAFRPNDSAPEIAYAHYDPRTGQYATPQGQVYTQANLVKKPTSWRDLILDPT